MWTIARVLPPPAASRVGAALLGWLGPLLRKHRHIRRNLDVVLPGATPEALEHTARDVWRNLGGVLFEYPHLEEILARTDAVSMPASVRRLFDTGTPAMFVTAHLANWELLASYVATRSGGLVVVYNPDENPYLERLIQGLRRSSGSEYVSKHEALRRLTPAHLKGRSIGMLLDVRVDSGTPLPLFGRDAPTTVSPFRMALRLGYPVVPIRAIRAGPARFEIEFFEPLEAPSDAKAPSAKAAAIHMAGQFNQLLERWIGERPGEWLCTKRRWPKAAAQDD
jgi:KDO2-lipid IV(A) lauroyltransferase